jgi:uncharacterized protein
VNTKDEILSALRSHDHVLRKYQVRSLAVFGSAARDVLRESSDIDVLVEFDCSPTFDLYMDLKLEELLQRPVDLVTTKALKPRMRSIVEREAIYVS